MDWYEARNECRAVGKRLCSDTEWTLACEGQERLPYPYGYVRNAEACNIDKPYIVARRQQVGEPRDARRGDRAPRPARAERRPRVVHQPLRRLRHDGQRRRVGRQREAARSKEKPYVSGLKGGYWGPVRDRCRPMTTDHNQWHTGYQIGFRCCEDVPATPGRRARRRGRRRLSRRGPAPQRGPRRRRGARRRLEVQRVDERGLVRAVHRGSFAVR